MVLGLMWVKQAGMLVKKVFTRSVGRQVCSWNSIQTFQGSVNFA